MLAEGRTAVVAAGSSIVVEMRSCHNYYQTVLGYSWCRVLELREGTVGTQLDCLTAVAAAVVVATDRTVGGRLDVVVGTVHAVAHVGKCCWSWQSLTLCWHAGVGGVRACCRIAVDPRYCCWW